MKKFLLFLCLFSFSVFAVDSNGRFEASDLTPLSLYIYQVDSSGQLASVYHLEVSSWDDVYNALYNSKISVYCDSSFSNISQPAFPSSHSTNSLFSSVDSYRWVQCRSSPSCPFSFNRNYFSPAIDPKCSSLFSAALALHKSGFSSSNLSSSGRILTFNSSLLYPEVLASPTSSFRDTLLSNLSSVYTSVQSINSSIQSIDSVFSSLLSDYRSVNSSYLGDYSSLSNQLYSLAAGVNPSGYYFPTSSLLADLDPSNYDDSSEGRLALMSSQNFISHGLDSYYRLMGLSSMIHSMDILGNRPLGNFVHDFGTRFNSDLENSVNRLGNSFSNALEYSFNTPSSNNVFQASLQGVFSNNWHLITNDHNVVNKALQNITNYIQGADLGQIHNALSNIVDNTLPLPSVYRKDDNSLRVYVVNPSSPAYPPGEDPSSQIESLLGGWIGEGGTNTWNLFAGNMLVDLEELLDLVRAFRYDFQQWSHDWDNYHDESLDHFNVHRSYVSYITNFVADVLEPTMVMLKQPLEDYTNVLSVAHSRLESDYDLENVSTLGLASAMLGHIPETESLIHDVQQLTNVVDLSSRSLVVESLARTNEVCEAVSLYYKNTSLPSKIDLNIYGDISFSIPVAEQASLWLLLRNGLAFGLFIVNVLLFPKFLLHLLRLLFGAVDSFYANQAKP